MREMKINMGAWQIRNKIKVENKEFQAPPQNYSR